MNNKELNYNKESQQKWYEKRGRKYYKEYYELNKDKVREYQKQYYEKNKYYIRRRQKNYFHKTYKNNKTYYQNYYLSNRSLLLDKVTNRKQYGNGIVNIKQGSFIVSFK